MEAHLGGADGITVHLREDRRHIQDEDVRRLRELTHIKLNLEMAGTDEMVGIACRIKPRWRCSCPRADTKSLPKAGSTSSRKKTTGESRGPAARRGNHRFGIHRRGAQAGRGRETDRRLGLRDPYRSVRTRVPLKGRDAESPAVVLELDKIHKAGEAIRSHGMRFNAGHALNYFNVQPVAALPGVRELHIGHAIVSRAVFVGMREAVRG